MTDVEINNALIELRNKVPEDIWRIVEEYCGDWSTLQWIQTTNWLLDNYEPTYQGLLEYNEQS